MLKILLVDDEPTELANLKLAAEGKDHKLFCATNAADAQGLIEAHEFDLIVTDLVMAREEAGFSVLKASRKKDETAPVIVVTSQASSGRMRRALDLGAFDFVDRNAVNVDPYGHLKHKIKIALKHRQALAALHATAP